MKAGAPEPRAPKAAEIRRYYRVDEPLAFVDMTLADDRSDFLPPLEVEVRREGGDCVVEVHGAVAIANTIAYRSEMADPIGIFLGLTRQNPCGRSPSPVEETASRVDHALVLASVRLSHGFLEPSIPTFLVSRTLARKQNPPILDPKRAAHALEEPIVQNASPGGRSSGASERLSEQASAIAEEERLRILAVARGCCPKCGAAPVSVPCRGIELDKCSRCEEVWLDVGELDHVLGEEGEFRGGLRRIFR